MKRSLLLTIAAAVYVHVLALSIYDSLINVGVVLKTR
jgi:hypothetical protein